MKDFGRKLLGVTVMLSALSLPLLRADDQPVEVLVSSYGTAPSDFLDLDGQLVHLRDEGPRHDPVPVLLLHGTSSSLHTWDGWAKALKASRRVIRIDLPGFGLTGPWTGPQAGQPYLAGNEREHVIRLLDRLRIRQVDLVGHGFGGEVAWQLAAAAPDRVRRLVLVASSGLDHSTAPGGHRSEQPLAWQMARVPVLGRVGEWMLTRGFVREGLVTAYGQPERITDAQVERYYLIALRSGNRAAQIRHLRQWQPQSGVPQMPPIAAPTLVLWGGADRILPSAWGERLTGQIRGARWQSWPDLGHLPQEEDPARSVVPVLAFLGETGR